MGLWATEIVDSQSGDWIADVEAARASGDWGVGDSEIRSHVFPLRNNGFTRAQNRSMFRPWVRTLVRTFNGEVVYAGLIIRTRYNRTTGRLTVYHAPLPVLLWRRYLFGVDSYSPTATVGLTNLSRRGIVRELLRIGLVFPFSPAWPMPVTLPVLEGGSESRTFYHYDFERVGQLIDTESNDEGGPDWDLTATRVNGKLVWTARIGNPYLPGATHELSLDDDSPITGYMEDEAGDNQATGIFAVGAGSEQDMKVGWASLSFTTDRVSRDFQVVHDTIADKARLDGLARARLDATKVPRKQRTFNVRLVDDPSKTPGLHPARTRVGDTIRVHSQDDPWIDDGYMSMRIIGMSGTFAQFATLTVEDI